MGGRWVRDRMRWLIDGKSVADVCVRARVRSPQRVRERGTAGKRVYTIQAVLSRRAPPEE